MATSSKHYGPEMRAFKLYFSKLVGSIPLEMAAEFYSNDLISRELHKTVVDITGSKKVTKVTESKMVTKVLLAVEGQMVMNPSVFHKFVAVMRTDPSLVHIADVLSDQYRK